MLCCPMSKATHAITAALSPGERDYIRRELDQFFSTLPSVADGLQLRTWRGGPQAGRPKVPAAAQGLLDRGLVRLQPTPWPPRLFFTEAGLAALRAMMADGRLATPRPSRTSVGNSALTRTRPATRTWPPGHPRHRRLPRVRVRRRSLLCPNGIAVRSPQHGTHPWPARPRLTPLPFRPGEDASRRPRLTLASPHLPKAARLHAAGGAASRGSRQPPLSQPCRLPRAWIGWPPRPARLRTGLSLLGTKATRRWPRWPSRPAASQRAMPAQRSMSARHRRPATPCRLSTHQHRPHLLHAGTAPWTRSASTGPPSSARRHSTDPTRPWPSC